MLGPLNPAETGDALGLTGADAIDAHLVSGGLPGILRAWPHATAHTASSSRNATTPPPRSSPFPRPRCSPSSPSRTRPAASSRPSARASAPTRTSPPRPAGAKARSPSGSLSPLLHRLTEDKHVLEIDHPLSTQPGKPALYRIADPNLRFYLAALRQAEDLVRRGRTEAAFRLIERRWHSYRGKAVEPTRPRRTRTRRGRPGSCPGRRSQRSAAGGTGASTRRSTSSAPTSPPTARHIYFTGSIKWLGTPFDRHDLTAHHAAAVLVPGHEPGSTGTVIVSLSGTDLPAENHGVDLAWGPEQIIDTWR